MGEGRNGWGIGREVGGAAWGWDWSYQGVTVARGGHDTCSLMLESIESRIGSSEESRLCFVYPFCPLFSIPLTTSNQAAPAPRRMARRGSSRTCVVAGRAPAG